MSHSENSPHARQDTNLSIDFISIDKTATRDWIRAKIFASTLDQDPLPHIIISDFFPPELYAHILRMNPFYAVEGYEWISRQDSQNLQSATPYWARKQYNLINDSTTKAPPPVDRFWRDLWGVFNDDDWFFNLLRERLPFYFHYRYGPLCDDADFRSFFTIQQFLQRHDRNYFIGPHTDIPTRVATCIFSFADKEGYERFGTELCKPRDRLVRCSGRTHHATDAFEVVKISPYRPNNFLLFLKTPHSFHSVTKFDQEITNDRFGMQIQLYEANNGCLKDLSAIKPKDGVLFMEKDKSPDTNGY